MSTNPATHSINAMVDASEGTELHESFEDMLDALEEAELS